MRRWLWSYGKLVCGLLLLLGVVGCAVERPPVFVKDGKTYGVTSGYIWRGRWWNYYESGVSLTEGAFWEPATAAFQEALTQRQADQRHARTYGEHFLDYFPHRELGIAFYHLDRYMDAIRELETSLQTVDSAKAKVYLNKARRDLLKQSGRDTTAPRLDLESPLDGQRTNRLSLTVQGRATDDTYVAAVAIQGQELFIELAEPHLVFRQEVALVDGPNVIHVAATDLLRRQTRAQRTVYVDRYGPLVSLERVTVRGEPAQRRVQVEGSIADQSPIRRFLLAGMTVSVQPETAFEFREDLPLAADATSVPFEIEDAAGNVTRGDIALASPAPPAPGVREGNVSPDLPRWAALHQGLVLSDLQASLPPPQRVVAQAQEPPPVMRLTELQDEQSTYNDTIYLGGVITSASPVVALSINGASQLPASSHWRSKSRQLFFAALMPLQVGANRFHLEAQDETGQRTQRDIVVTRQEQAVMRLEARLSIVVLPFAPQGEPSALSEATYDHLMAAFAQQRRFRLVERQRLADILREQELSRSRLADPTTAISIGRMATAEGTISGVVLQQAPQRLEVIAHFTDVETTEWMATLDVYGEDLTLSDIKPLMQGLAWKFQQYFPLTTGVVRDRKDKYVFVDHGGLPASLKQHMKMILFRDGAALTDRRTGVSFGYQTKPLGEARVEEVSTAVSKAVLLQPAQQSEVKTLDKYITK